MRIPRLSMITLGVADLAKAASFYEDVLSVPPNRSYDGVVFIELSGSWLSLYPIDALAADISPEITPARTGFNGITLAHNVRNREDVIAIIDRARNAGARILREPQETFWGGFNGYFADHDGYCWEIAWGPMFGFDEHGDMHFQAG